MKPVRQILMLYTTEKQARALRRFAASRKVALSAVVRDAVAEYLERYADEPLPRPGEFWGPAAKAGTGKTPPRIMLHLSDRKRLKMLRIQSKTLKGTHRSVGRVIRAAIEDYLEAHAKERRELLRGQRLKLGKRSFSTWKRSVERGPAGEERD